MIEQTIQEVKFQDIIISKKQNQARKSNKLRHWLEYLNMLDGNKNTQKKNQVILQMQKSFILREDFWEREAQRIFADEQPLQQKTFQLIFHAMQDGFYIRVAEVISQKLYQAYSQAKLRKNYVIAKLEQLIEQFNHRSDKCSQFFQILIQIYAKCNETKKIRQTYLRQIQMGFNNYDVAFSNYLSWQKQLQASLQQPSYQQDAQKAFSKSQQLFQQTQEFEEDQIPELMNTSIDKISNNKSLINNHKNIKRCIVYLQEMNVLSIDEKRYLKLLALLPSDYQRLWYLRRMALSQTHQLVQHYLDTLQTSNAQDQQIINAYKMSFGWQDGIQYEKPYLQYLIRRINKHLLETQQQEYNESWGTNVQFFRNQISALISKQRPAAMGLQKQKQLRQSYYFLWIQVETFIVKDVKSVEELFESLLEWQKREQLYIKYAQYLVNLGCFSKAKFIYQSLCQSTNSDNGFKSYQQFLLLYGSLAEIKKVNKLKDKKIQMLKLQIAQQSQLIEEYKKESSLKEKLKQNTEIIKALKGQHQDENHQQTPIQLQSQSQKSNASLENLQQAIQKNTEKDEKQFKRPSPALTKQQPIHEIGQQSKVSKKVHLDKQNTLFSKNIRDKWTEADIMLNLIHKEEVKEIRIVQKQRGKLCYIQFNSDQSAQKELDQNRSSLGLAFSKPHSKSDDCTLFLCNLPISMSHTQIEQIIQKEYQSQIKEIRSKDKGDKKTAYIEFNCEQIRDQVLLALKQEKIKFNGRDIIVKSCESDHKVRDKKSKTIFLKNLAFKCKQKDIREFFEKQGFQNIAQIFIPKDQNTNRVKGYAYVELQSSNDVQKAVGIQKGDLMNRTFTIHRSDRGITHHHNQREQQKSQTHSDKQNKTKSQSATKQNKKSNNFFKNFFS